MDRNIPPQKTRQQIEDELMEAPRQRHLEWGKASDGHRDVARRQFMNALHIFNSLVLLCYKRTI